MNEIGQEQKSERSITKFLNNTQDNRPNLPASIKQHDFRNLNLDPYGWILSLAGNNEKSDNFENSDAMASLRNLVELGLIKAKSYGKNKRGLAVEPTKLGIHIQTRDKKIYKTYQPKHNRLAKVNDNIIKFDLFLGILAIPTLLLGTVSGALLTISFFGLLVIVYKIDKKLQNNFENKAKFTEKQYLNLINKYANSKQQRLFKKELSRINKKKLQQVN